MVDNLATILLPTAYQDTDANIVEGPFTITSATYRLGSGLSVPYPVGAPLIPKGAGMYAPPSAPTAGLGITTGNLVSNGHYSWSMSLVTDWGETVPGTVTGVTIVSGGTGYTSAPTVAFSAPTGAGGVTATGTAQISGGVVTGITVTNPGSGYVTPPTVTLTGGGFTTAATATSTINVLTISALGAGNTGQVINLPGWSARLDNPVRLRRLYRTVNNGTQLYLVAEMDDANQTVYIDEVSDTELLSGGASTVTAPISNTSGSAINPGTVDVFDGTTHWTEVGYASGSPPTATKTFSVDYSVLTGGYVYFYSGDVGKTGITITYKAGTLLSSTWINQYKSGLQEVYNYFRTESTPYFSNNLQVNGALYVLSGDCTFQEDVYFNDVLDLSANHGVINIGDGPFDGVSAGRFAGNANGTYIAANALSTNNNFARLIDLQWGGTTMFSVDGQGTVTLGGHDITTTSTSGLAFTAANDLTLPGDMWSFENNYLAASSGSQAYFTVEPGIKQTGTASYTALKVNVINEVTYGSGARNLLDLQYQNVSQFSVAYNSTFRFAATPGFLATSTFSFTTTDGGVTLPTFTIQGPSFFNSASTDQGCLYVRPFVQQTGTASYYGIMVNASESSTGSGVSRLLDLQVGNTSKFKVDNKGKATMSSLALAGGGTPTVTANSGLGTAPTISVATGSTDYSGLINFTVGTSPTGGTQFTVNFSAALPSAPRLVVMWFQGANVGIGAVTGVTASSFSIASTGFTAGQAYGIGWMLVF